MRRLLLILGIACLLLALAWPWLVRHAPWRWLGHLPGDIRVERDGSHFYFPLVTCIVLSLVISLVMWLLRR
jgi:hypothetical protein